MSDGPIESLNPNLLGMGHSATVAINERSNELLAAGRDIYKLGLGQSPFPVPRPVVRALQEHAHQKDYLAVQGLLELRQAVASYHSKREGIELSADDVLIGPGSKELMFLAQLAYDASLLVPAPSWVSYEPQARIIGRRVTWIVTGRDSGWLLDPAALDAICTSEGERPRLLILNYPSNPTGATFDDEQLVAIAEVARKHRILVLSDEIYGEVQYDGTHVSIARHYPEGTIISSGLSKWCGAGGWRLGTFAFPSALSWLKDAMAAVASETFTTTSAPIQYAAVTAFNFEPEIELYLLRSRRILGGLSRWIRAQLEAVGASCGQPRGGFYLFPDFSALGDQLKKRNIHSSPMLCKKLIEETGVAVLPGSEFGRPANEMTLRLAFVDFDGAETLDAVAEMADDSEIGETFLREHCRRVVKGVELMCEWVARDA